MGQVAHVGVLAGPPGRPRRQHGHPVTDPARPQAIGQVHGRLAHRDGVGDLPFVEQQPSTRSSPHAPSPSRTGRSASNGPLRSAYPQTRSITGCATARSLPACGPRVGASVGLRNPGGLPAEGRQLFPAQAEPSRGRCPLGGTSTDRERCAWESGHRLRDLRGGAVREYARVHEG